MFDLIDLISMSLSNVLYSITYTTTYISAHSFSLSLYSIIMNQILLQQNCEKIQQLEQRNQHDYNLAMLIGALFSCFGIILILLAFVLWRWVDDLCLLFGRVFRRFDYYYYYYYFVSWLVASAMKVKIIHMRWTRNLWVCLSASYSF